MQSNITNSLVVINREQIGLLIEKRPHLLYDEITKIHSLIVARNGFDPNGLGMNTTQREILEMTISKMLMTITHFGFLGSLLEYHSRFARSGELNLTAKAFCPAKIIIVEIESYISCECEFLLLLYVYLLRTGHTLPRLYILMSCYVEPIVEFVSNLLSIANRPLGVVGVNELSLQDYFVSQQNYIDMTRSSNYHVALDCNKEVFDLVEEGFSFGVNSTKRCFIRCHRLNDLIPHVLKADLVCIDATIRIQNSWLYAGNRRVKRTASNEWLIGVVSLLKELNPQVKIVILYTQETIPLTDEEQISCVVRENQYRDFTQDVVVFMRNQLCLLNLYKFYLPDDTHVRSRISHAKGLLEKLDFLTIGSTLSPESFLITAMKIHPLMARIILIWKQEGRPLFPILLFTAVVYSFEKTTREVKEHGLKEVESDVSMNCRFGEAMNRSLEIIKRTGQADSSELGRTRNVLGQYITKMNEYLSREKSTTDSQEVKNEVKIGFFDLNRFNELLSNLLRKNFPSEILTRVQQGAKSGTIMYFNQKHPNISWRVGNNPSFNEIFPIVSILERNSNKVIFYVPL
jgi:hypothetical protein